MSQTDPIQALIQDIDEVLQKTMPRLPWVMSNESIQQRQVLEQARTYLADLQSQQETRQEASPEESLEALPETGQAIALTSSESSSLLPSGQPAAESAQQVLQSVLQEMSYLRVNLLQPMRSDVELLRQQREALTQEIRQLEAQRHGLQPQANPQLANSQILMEFLQSAMAQMQENLRGQVLQIVASLSTLDQPTPDQPLLSGSEVNSASLGSSLANLAGGSEAIAALSPVQRLEQIQRVQSQSDQLLLKLDSTVQVIFESLQGNLQSYQDSLEQGLSRIHNLGQQGEVMVEALVNRLAEQVGREASSYLQSTILPASPLTEPTYLSARSNPETATNTATNTATDTEIARLLDELNALDADPNKSQSSENRPGQNQPGQNQLDGKSPDAAIDTRWQPQPFTLDATPGSLAALSQELQQLDLVTVPIEAAENDEDLTIFQTDFQAEPSSTSLAFNYRGVEPWGDESERTQFQVGSERSSAALSQEVEDLDSALDLLNQLGVAARAAADAAIAAEAALESGGESTAEAGVEAEAEAAEPPLVSSPESLYEDEFYQTLFGDPQDEAVGDQAIALNPTVNLDNPDNSESLSELPIRTSDSEMAFGDLFSGMQDEAGTQDGDRSTETKLDSSEIAADADASPDLLFEGFGDPAANSVQAADSDFLSDFPSPALPSDPPQDLQQSMENFLLFPQSAHEDSLATSLPEPLNQNSDQTSSLDSLGGELDDPNLFWDAPKTSPQSQTERSNSPDAVEVIRTLTDLIPSADLLSTDGSSTGAISSLNYPDRAGFGEDAFEPAEASEDLLALETSSTLPIAELEIGEDTLQQLAADLSNLEQNRPAELHELPDSADPMARSAPPQRSASLDDLFAEMEAGDRQSSAAASETVEELLFTTNLDPIQPETPASDDASHADSLDTDSTDSPDSNAFTLEGLDSHSLFETLSDTAATQPAMDATKLANAEVAEQTGTSIEDIFGEQAAESASPKKKN